MTAIPGLNRLRIALLIACTLYCTTSRLPGQWTYVYAIDPDGYSGPSPEEVRQGNDAGGSQVLFNIPVGRGVIDVEADESGVYALVIDRSASLRTDILRDGTQWMAVGANSRGLDLTPDSVYYFDAAQASIVRIDKQSGTRTPAYSAPVIGDLEVVPGPTAATDTVFWTETVSGIINLYRNGLLFLGVPMATLGDNRLGLGADDAGGRVFVHYAPNYSLSNQIDEATPNGLVNILSYSMPCGYAIARDIEVRASAGGLDFYTWARDATEGGEILALLKNGSQIQATGGCFVQAQANLVEMFGILPATPECTAPITVPFGGKFRRVDIHGIPMPEGSPADRVEADREASALYVDTYSLNAYVDMSDIRLPVEGGDLELEFRRTASVTLHQWSSQIGKQSITHPSDRFLGPGWTSNLSSHIIIFPEACIGKDIVTVIDDVGTSYRYEDNGLLGASNPFPPDTYFSMNAQAQPATLFRRDTTTLVLEKTYGTRLTYQLLMRAYPPSGPGAYYEDYYRLISVEDRNGNRIIRTYASNVSGNRLSYQVASMHEEAHPERRISFAYSNGTGGNGMDWGDRLVSVTDPLGQVTSFAYGPSGGQPWDFLLSVTRPRVIDGETRNMVTPVTHFTYHAAELPTEQTTDPNVTPQTDLTVRNRLVGLASVTDPRGQVTSLLYTDGYFPSSIGTSSSLNEYGKRIHLTSLTTFDGQVLFHRPVVTHEDLRTEVTDTRGNVTIYEFLGTTQPAQNLIRSRLTITSLRRTNVVGSVEYTWSDDAYSNLIGVTDVNGNTVSFEYATQASKQQGQPTKESMRDTSSGEFIETRYQYGTFGKLVQVTDGEGKVISHTLDSNGNRMTTAEELGKTTRRTFSSDGFITSVTDPDGRRTTYSRAFDPGSLQNYYQVTETVEGYSQELSITSVRTYDALGNLVRLVDPNGYPYTYGYDALYRQVTRTEPLSGSWGSTFTLNGDPVEDRDFLGNVTLRTYDRMNRLTEERRRLGSPGSNSPQDIVTAYTYDAAGRKETEADGEGNVTRYRYDAALRLIEAIFDEGVLAYRELYEYDGENSGSGAFSYTDGWQPTRRVDRRGFPTDTTYDGFYRPVRTIVRNSAGRSYASAPAADEPTSDYLYNRAHNEIRRMVRAEPDAGGTRVLYTVYDDLHRKIAEIIDFDGDENEGSPYAGPSGIASYAPGWTGDPDDQVFLTGYDLRGNQTTQTDPEQHTTQTIFDGASRPIVLRQPQVALGVPETHTDYDDSGNAILITDPNGNATEVRYDARNREVTRILDYNGDGVFDVAVPGPDIVTSTAYDAMGNKTSSIDANGNTYSYAYDRGYRQVWQQDPEVLHPVASQALVHPEWITEYDKNSNPIRTIDPNGVITVRTYDGLDRVTRQTVASGTAVALTTDYQYDANDNITARVLDNRVPNLPTGGLQRTEFAYDPFNRKISEAWPDLTSGGRVTTHEYFRNGLPKKKTDPRGQVHEYRYDPAGRMIAGTYIAATGTIEESRTYSYDRANNLVSVQDRTGLTSLGYDALYRITRETRTDQPRLPYTTDCEYDLIGNRVLTRFPRKNGSDRRIIRQTFDRMNRLTEVYDEGFSLGRTDDRKTLFRYDANSNLLQVAAPNNVQAKRTYDGLNRTTSRLSVSRNGNVYRAEYNYDLRNNISELRERVGLGAIRHMKYRYDEQYRLVQEQAGGVSTLYTYDWAGNRLTMAGGGQILNYRYNERNELLSVSRGAKRARTFIYDFNGNAIKDIVYGDTGGQPVTTDYTWDTSNRLVSAMRSDGVDFSAEYDYRHRRVLIRENRVETLFRYHEGLCHQEVKNGEVGIEFVRAIDMGGGVGSILYAPTYGERDDQTDYFCPNHLGHTVAITDQDGRVTSTEIFDAFGVSTLTTGRSENTRRAYTKERSEALGLDNHGFRYYDPALGRYISRDPADYADGLNVYLHAGNNPGNRFDPQGLAWKDLPLAALRGGSRGAYNLIVGSLGLATVVAQANPFNTDYLSRQRAYQQIFSGVSGIPGQVDEGYKGFRRGVMRIRAGQVTGTEYAEAFAQATVEYGSPLGLLKWAGRLTKLPRGTRFAGGKNVPDTRVGTGHFIEGPKAIESAPSHTSSARRSGRGRNKLEPDPSAPGPHSTWKIDVDGDARGYVEWKPNPKNPWGFDEVKRVDLKGDSHYNKVLGEDIPTPHVHERGSPGGVRHARPDELPTREK